MMNNTEFNLASLLSEKALQQPLHVAIVGPGKDDSWSYQALNEYVGQRADMLRSAGVKPGDTVGLHYPSGRQYIVYTYALWLCGASVVPIAVELSADEKQVICADIVLNALISPAKTAALFQNELTPEPLPLGDQDLLIPLQNQGSEPEGYQAVNPAFLRFSSGTTGLSKGVILSHESIYERINAANAVLKIGPEDKILWLLSMSYHFAVSIVAYLSFGATIVLAKNHFGSTLVRTAAQAKATLIYGSPVHYDHMAHDTTEPPLTDGRLAVSTAMYRRADIAAAFQSRFALPLSEAYGIIEVGLPCINHDRPGDKSGSVGRVLPDYELYLEDVGLGEQLMSIKFRGRGVLDAYFEPWRTREQIMADGWFETGDLGYTDADGYLFIQGRSKEIINTGGMKFFPQEVEACLELHPAVMEACVFSHPDQRMGETPYANVVLHADVSESPDEQVLKALCAKNLASFKVPEQIAFVGELLRTASGKLIRQQMKIQRN